MKRIAILVNKDFEYAGFIEGLRDTVEIYTGTNGRAAECRFDNLNADIYCIQNLFKEGENSSNSELKYGYLKDLFKSNAFRIKDCDGVLSFSTSESTPFIQGGIRGHSRNGCVYVGNRFFLSDQHVNDNTTTSHLKIGDKKTSFSEFYSEKPIYSKLYDFLNLIDMKLKTAHINPSDKTCCIANSVFAGIGVVNVIDYSCYKKADKAAYKLFHNYPIAYAPFTEAIGIETTHGVVVKALREVCLDLRLDKEVPVNFISPIVDRYLKFDEDVDGKYGKQNFTCSYNGGVVTGHMLNILNYNM